MTKTTVKTLEARVIALENRIAELEALLSQNQTTANTTRINTVEPQEQVKQNKKAPIVVGNLIFDGKYVKTGTGFMSSKTRYAISQSITKDFNGKKLGKGNPVYEKCVKTDKYVQVYEFATVKECKKFMEAQMSRVGK